MKETLDKRAVKILHDTFWSPQGWKREREPALNSDDFNYAKAKGVMFEPVHMDHAQAVGVVRQLVDRLDRRTVVDAFLASLSTRRLDWRSALGSYSVFQHLIHHEVQATARRCEICGFYLEAEEHKLNVLNFERTKWGGVRHTDLVYAALDLNIFLESVVPPPTSDDVNLFQAVVDAIRSAGPDVSAATLQSCLPKALKSNKAERDVIVSILGFCDVLARPPHTGYSAAFIPANRRPLPPRRFTDMPYPACWWSGEMGVNEVMLKTYFGHVL